MADLAIVGIGRWGRVLVDAVSGQSDTVRFTHGVTRTPAKAQDYAAAKGITLLPSLEAALADPAIDGIVLATPHSQHADQIKAAAAAGKPVFCEKPVTLTRESAAEAMAAVEAAGVVFAAGHNRRFLPAMAHLHTLVTSGELGDIINVEGNMSSHIGGRYTADSWRLDTAESPAGGLAGAGIHIIDAMIHLLGPITEVLADSRRIVHDIPLDDTTTILMRFANGPSGYLTAMTATAPIVRLQVFGTRGWAVLDGQTRLVHQPLSGPRVTHEFAAVSTERAQLEAFARAIEGGAPYPVPLADVVAGVAAFEAITRSAAERRWTTV